ncbi:GxGYxYP domain-containing protein [Lacunimicrobium album]
MRSNCFVRLCYAGLMMLMLMASADGTQGQETSGTPVYPSRSVDASRDQLPTVFPRSAIPADKLFVFNAVALPRETQALVASIQGLVNREKPELYLILSRNRINPIVEEGRREPIDRVWLDWLTEKDYVESHTPIESIESLLAQYQIRDVVVIDPAFPASVNIATMISSVRGIPMAYPSDVEKYKLNPVEDTRGRWKTNIEAYQWAWENLWPQMNQSAIAIFSPNINGHLRDYLVEHKIFTFWISNKDYQDDFTTNHDLEDFKKMLKQMPVNIPVLGYPNSGGKDSGIGEGLGVKLLSDHGKFLVPTDWHTNLSVWTGWDHKTQPLKHLETRKLTYDPAKRYLCILVSDGDNMNLWLDFMPTEKYWRSPLRGKFPVAWTMGPAMLQLHAPLLDYYYDSLTPMDSFGCAVSGIGYMYPLHYGEAYGSHQQEILKQYHQLTNQFNEKLNLRWYWGTIVGERGGTQFADVARELKGMTCLMEGYGRQWWRDEPYLTDGIPTFHFLNDAVPEKQTEEQVTRMLRRRDPKFGIVFIQNWEFDMEKMKKLMDGIEGEVEWVLPEELADVYLQSLKATTGK